MPWRIVKGHGGCSDSRPYAVVKEGSSEKVACHPSRAKAQKHIAALYANERRRQRKYGAIEGILESLPERNETMSPSPQTAQLDAALDASTPDASTPDSRFVPVQIVLVPEGVRTSERLARRITPGTLTWRTPPLPLLYQRRTKAGHEESVVVGTINDIARVDGEIRGTGFLDMALPDAPEAHTHISNQTQRWVSVDLELPKGFDLVEESDGTLTAEFGGPRLMGATIVAFPAFPQAVIALASHTIPDSTPDGRAAATPFLPESLAAGGGQKGRRRPPSEWFSDPGFTALTPMTVTDEGRIYGHFAAWGSCHVGFQDVCVMAPRSATNYAHFLLGETKVDDCECDSLATGVITMDTSHARAPLSPSAAIAHYEQTGLGVADVIVGEDQFGPWVAGAVRPHLTDDQLHALRAAKLSGDWRRVGNSLELVALLAVNTPGFPVPRLAASIRDGRQVSLVAAGWSDPTSTVTGEQEDVAEIEDADPNDSLNVVRQFGIPAPDPDPDAPDNTPDMTVTGDVTMDTATVDVAEILRSVRESSVTVNTTTNTSAP